MKRITLIVLAGALLATSCDKGGPDFRLEAVDLGLSVRWASFNLGASRPEGYGVYYQWADTVDVTSTGIYLDWSNCPYHTGSDEDTGWTKYVPSDKGSYWSGPGSPDNKTVLDPSDDVAHVKLGGSWRMPTIAEWEELLDNCTWTWTDNYNGTGVAGRIVTGRKPGYTDKSIFLPAAGYRNGSYLTGDGSNGAYWSSSLGEDYPNEAYGVFFKSDNVIKYNIVRCSGRSARAVTE